MTTFFLNTGVQRLIVEKEDGDLEELGIDPTRLTRHLASDWHFSNHPFVRVYAERRRTTSSFVLALDTREGSAADGHVGTRESLFELGNRPTFRVSLPVPDDSRTELELCAITFADEEPVPVALVLDVGNTRTCGLIIEDDDPDTPIGPDKFRPALLHSLRQPLVSGTSMLDSTLEFVPPQWRQGPGQYVLKSRPLLGLWDSLKRALIGHPLVVGDLTYRPSKTFANDSIAALGSDAVAWRRQTHHLSPPTTGLSSPKRYLWADALADAAWKYAQPADEGRDVELLPISGDILLYVTADDSELFLHQDNSEPVGTDRPTEPRYPKRTMSVFFLFELLKSFHVFANSHEFRTASRQAARPRMIADLVLTYPSALGLVEIDSYATQARKAIKIFETLYGPNDRGAHIRLHTRWDEGIASQLCYVASEVRRGDSVLARSLTAGGSSNVASIDFGGGTIDAAVASYSRTGQHGEFKCQVECIDGDFVGGDDLVRLLIRELVLEQLQDFAKDESSDLLLPLFRERTQSNAAFRIRMLREVLIPLAHGILEATAKSPPPASLAAIDFCRAESLDSLGEYLLGAEGRGRLRTWEYRLDSEVIRQSIDRCFGATIKQIIERMPSCSLDAMILAGRLASLPGVVSLVGDSLRTLGNAVPLIPFQSIRGIPDMHRDIFGGARVDPKVSVVLGAAMAFTGAWGRAASGLRFTVDYESVAGPFFWGLVDADTLRFSELLGGVFFSPPDREPSIVQLPMARGSYYVGRRLATAGGTGPATLRYRLTVHRQGPVAIRRIRDPKTSEEILRLEDTNHAKNAQLLDQSHLGKPYWLDTGMLWDSGDE